MTLVDLVHSICQLGQPSGATRVGHGSPSSLSLAGYYILRAQFAPVGEDDVPVYSYAELYVMFKCLNSPIYNSGKGVTVVM